VIGAARILRALVAKDLAVLTGRKGLWIARTGFVGILFASVAVAWLIVGERPRDPKSLPALGRTVSVTLGCGSVFLAGLAAAFMAAGAAAADRTRGSLEVLLSAPLSPILILLSIAVASVMVVCSFLLAAIPLFAVPLFVGGVGPAEIVSGMILPSVAAGGFATLAVARNAGRGEQGSAAIAGSMAALFNAWVSFTVQRIHSSISLFFWLGMLSLEFAICGVALVLASHPRPKLSKLAPARLGERLLMGTERPDVAQKEEEDRSRSILPSWGGRTRRQCDRWPRRNAFAYLERARNFGQPGDLELAFLLKVALGIPAALLVIFAPIILIVHYPGERASLIKGAGYFLLLGGTLLAVPVVLTAGTANRIIPMRSDTGLLDALLSSPLSGRDVIRGGLCVTVVRARLGIGWVGVCAFFAGIISLRPVLPFAFLAFACSVVALAHGVALWCRLLVSRPGEAAALTFGMLVVPIIIWFIVSPSLPVALRPQSWFEMRPSAEAGMALMAGVCACVACLLFGTFEACFDRAMGRPAARGAKA